VVNTNALQIQVYPMFTLLLWFVLTNVLHFGKLGAILCYSFDASDANALISNKSYC